MFFLHKIESRLDSIIFYDLFRSNKIKDDLINLNVSKLEIKNSTKEYIKYIEKLNNEDIFAHVYVWYMGDLNGGQIIKNILNFKTSSLEFDNSEKLKKEIMDRVNVKMINEINACFDWAILILKEFEEDLIQETK